MSDNLFRLISTNPEHVPTSSSCEEARHRLAVLVPDADQVTARVTDHVQFIDPGANLERMSCPSGGAELDLDWWGDAMSTSHSTAFTDLDVDLPCCGSRSSLNDLDYEWPARFARFVLEARNPNITGISDEQVSDIASILGTPLRQIWAHL